MNAKTRGVFSLKGKLWVATAASIAILLGSKGAVSASQAPNASVTQMTAQDVADDELIEQLDDADRQLESADLSAAEPTSTAVSMPSQTTGADEADEADEAGEAGEGSSEDELIGESLPAEEPSLPEGSVADAESGEPSASDSEEDFSFTVSTVSPLTTPQGGLKYFIVDPGSLYDSNKTQTFYFKTEPTDDTTPGSLYYFYLVNGQDRVLLHSNNHGNFVWDQKTIGKYTIEVELRHGDVVLATRRVTAEVKRDPARAPLRVAGTYVDRTQLVKGSSTQSSAYVKVDLAGGEGPYKYNFYTQYNGGAFVLAHTNNHGNYIFAPSQLGDYVIRIEATDQYGERVTSTTPRISYQAVPPQVKYFVTDPADGVVQMSNYLYAKTEGVSAEPLTYTFRLDSGGQSTLLESNSHGNLYTNLAGFLAGSYQLRLEVADQSGGVLQLNKNVKIVGRPITLNYFIGSPASQYDSNAEGFYLKAEATSQASPIEYTFYQVVGSNLQKISANNHGNLIYLPSLTGQLTVEVQAANKDGEIAKRRVSVNHIADPPNITALHLDRAGYVIDQASDAYLKVDTNQVNKNLTYEYDILLPDGTVRTEMSNTIGALQFAFNEVGQHTVTVRAIDFRGRVSEKSINVDVFDKLKLNSIDLTPGDVVKVFDTLTIDVDATGGYGNKNYTINLIDQNGVSTKLSGGSLRSIKHSFLKTGAYKIKATVSDGLGNQVTLSKNITVNSNPVIITPYILPGASLTANKDAIFGASFVGGGNANLYRQEIYDASWNLLYHQTNVSRLTWKPTATGTYYYSAVVLDQLTAPYFGSTSFTVSAPSAGPKVSGMYLNQTTFTEDLDADFYANISATGATEYDFYAIRENEAPQLVHSGTYPALMHRFYVEGKYDMVVVAKNASGQYDLAKKAVTVKPNLPIVSRLTVDTSTYGADRTLRLNTGIKAGTGKPAYSYQYTSYSWKYGETLVAVNVGSNFSYIDYDPDVAAIRVVVTDLWGRQGTLLTRFTLPGSWAGHSGQVTYDDNDSTLVLNWQSVQNPTGFAIFNNGVLVADVKGTTRTFSTKSPAYGSSVDYQVIPYYSTTGGNYSTTAVADKFTNDLAYSRVQFRKLTELELFLLNNPGRKAVYDIAMGSIGKIPYYLGGKASGPGYAANNFGSYVRPDKAGATRRGLNCSGYVEWVFWTAGYGGYDTGDWSWTSPMMANSKTISASQLLPGDLGFKEGYGSYSNHVGIYLGNGLWAHLPSPGTWVLLNSPTYWTYFRRPRMW